MEPSSTRPSQHRAARSGHLGRRSRRGHGARAQGQSADRSAPSPRRGSARAHQLHRWRRAASDERDAEVGRTSASAGTHDDRARDCTDACSSTARARGSTRRCAGTHTRTDALASPGSRASTSAGTDAPTDSRGCRCTHAPRRPGAEHHGGHRSGAGGRRLGGRGSGPLHCASVHASPRGSLPRRPRGLERRTVIEREHDDERRIER